MKERKSIHETIYKFIYSEEGRILKLWQHLRHNKSSGRKKIGSRKTKNKLIIKESINKRKTIGSKEQNENRALGKRHYDIFL